MSETVEPQLDEARLAVRRRAWGRAYELLSDADAAGVLPPDALESLGQAAWADGRFDEAERARERAYAGYSELEDRPGAARMALALASDQLPRGHIPVARGWLATAGRLLADEPECAEHGRFDWIRGQVLLLFEGDIDGSMELTGRTAEIGRRLGDLDVEMLGVSTTARALTRIGRVREATALLDSAMTAATSGQLAPHTAQIVYCHTLCSCAEVQDHDRARSWSEVAESCCARDGIVPVTGDCRVHRAGIHLLAGQWAVAEQEARQGSEELGGEMVHRGFALYELGELHLRRGDLDEAEAAFRAAEEAATPAHPGLALVELAAGKAEVAAAMISDALDDARAPLARVLLLPAQVEIAITVGDLDSARAAAEELGAISARFESPALTAASEEAAGAVALAGGSADLAVPALRRAVRRWLKVGAPYEAARARLVLARAHLARLDTESATSELRAARDAFGRLGAVLQTRITSDLLRQAARAQGAAGAATRVSETFVFTDIVDSTRTIALIGDDAWVMLRRWHDTTLRSVFASHGGTEIDHAGDGFFVAFADASTAAACAVDIQRSLDAHRRLNGFAPLVRIGLHTAEVVVAGGDYQGAGVHVAARIGAAAAGGEILASAQTAVAAGHLDGQTTTLTLKGLPEPVDVTAISWRDG